MQPKVTVIIPVYNGAKHLRSCIESVLAQSLQEIEVLCIDDGSTDSSFQIIQEYCNTHTNLFLFRQTENQGPGPARNKGLSVARGEYIAFLDVDDAYPSQNSLLALYQTAIRENADICGGSLIFIGDSAVPKAVERCRFLCEKWISFQDFQQHTFFQRFLFKKALLDDNQIQFPSYLRFEDPLFLVRAMLAAKRFFALPDPVYSYRNTPLNVSWNQHKINDMLRGSLELIELCLKNNLNILYHELLYRYLKSKHLQHIVEDSLIHGNDYVKIFYRQILDSWNSVMLTGLEPQLDSAYAKTIAEWDGKRNITYSARSILLAQPRSVNPPAVSVIIPVYNTQHYLKDAIESILHQTQPSYEIICVNDGSTDQSPSILAEYAEHQSNLHVIHQSNQGLSAARNEGLRHAQGEYVFFMDSDDLLDPNALATLYQHASTDSLDILYFSADSFYDPEFPEEERQKYKQTMEFLRCSTYPDVVSGRQMIVLQEKRHEFHVPVWTQFYRTDFLRDNHLAFFEGLLHEDNLFTFSAALCAVRTGSIPDVLFHRRIRPSSITTVTRNYRNLLGLFLSVSETSRRCAQLQLQPLESAAIQSLLNARICNSVSQWWLQLSEADRALFLASLTAEDRTRFQIFVFPTIELSGAKKNARETKSLLDKSRKEKALLIEEKNKLRQEKHLLTEAKNQLRKDLKEAQTEKAKLRQEKHLLTEAKNQLRKDLKEAQAQEKRLQKELSASRQKTVFLEQQLSTIQSSRTYQFAQKLQRCFHLLRKTV